MVFDVNLTYIRSETFFKDEKWNLLCHFRVYRFTATVHFRTARVHDKEENERKFLDKACNNAACYKKYNFTYVIKTFM